MLVAHNPMCKLPPNDRHQRSHHQQQCAPLPLTMRNNLGPRGPINPVVVKQEPQEDDVDGKSQRSVIKPICLGGVSGIFCDSDSLNTPVVAASTPASTPSAPSLIFTYPSMLEPESPSPSSESCSKAHLRSSSSGDQSSDSLNSPTLLALWAGTVKMRFWGRLSSAPYRLGRQKAHSNLDQANRELCSWHQEPSRAKPLVFLIRFSVIKKKKCNTQMCAPVPASVVPSFQLQHINLLVEQ